MSTKMNFSDLFRVMVLLIFTMSFIACSSQNGENGHEESQPRVFFTSDISSEGLLSVYQALGVTPTGNVAVKIHSGEPGNPHYLKPDLIKELVQIVNGTLVETNVAYPSRRANTASHLIVAEEHGFTEIAPFVILDAIDDLVFPIENGKHLSENRVGGHFADFDFHIVLSHFKGHQMGGFGGAVKNVAIGYASAQGKRVIHSAGRSGGNIWDTEQEDFLESMAEATKTITDNTKDRILYINVMNHLSIDCDCNGNPSRPQMADIGILASLDPIALDKACVDLVYAATDGAALIQRMETMKAIRTLEYAEKLCIGKLEYVLVNID